MRCVLVGDSLGIRTLTQSLREMNFEIRGIVQSSNEISKKNILSSNFLFFVDSQNQSELLQFLIEDKVNLMLVCSFNKVFIEDIVSIPHLKAVNIHAGKLPKYRGSNVLNWAIINGETEIGVTVHEMVKMVDRGPIIAEWQLPIKPTDTALHVRTRMLASVEENLPFVLRGYIDGTIKSRAQKADSMKPFRKRKPEDGLFDWSWSNERIYNLIRALAHPWPGARYFDKFGNLQIIENYMCMDEIIKLRTKETL